MAKKSLSKRLTKKKKPAPISMSLHKTPPPRKAKAPVAVKEPVVVAPTTVSAPLPDSDLVHRVKALESAGTKEIVVTVPARPRIASVSIEYDQMGHPKTLVPSYSE